MKRIIAVLSIFAILFSFASCSVAMSEEKRMEKMAEIESKQEEASKKQAEYIIKKKDDIYSKIGKTEKDKRFVAAYKTDIGEEIMVVTFKNGKFEEKMNYFFVNSEENYKQMKEAGDKLKQKVYKTDDDAKLIIYKHQGEFLETYDEVYEYYESTDSIEIIK